MKKSTKTTNNSNKKEGNRTMKEIFTRKIETITMEEFMEVKTVTEHDTDYLLGEVDTKLKAFMEDMLENSQTLCTYHYFKYVVDALDDINNALKVVSYEIQKGFEALEAIRKIADEKNMDVAYYDMYITLAAHKFNAYASVWERYFPLKEEYEEYLRNNEEPTDHTHNF